MLLVLSFGSDAQNLVPNPGFEDYHSCPTGRNQVYNLASWFKPTNYTTDYLNTCTTGWPIALPHTYDGYITPKSGNGMVGIAYKYSGRNDSIEYHPTEYIEVELTDTLWGGYEYCLGLSMQLADSSMYGVSNFGMYLSKNKVQFLESVNYVPPFYFTPQLTTGSNAILDTTNWVSLENTFIAN